MAALIGCFVASAERSPMLGGLAQVLSLTNDDASREYPFQLKAQVTVFSSRASWLFLQDGPLGIYAICPEHAVLHAGDWIEAKGVTAQGGFAPILNLREVKVVGHSAPPVPFQLDNPTNHAPESVNIWAVLQGRILNSELMREGIHKTLRFSLRTKNAHSVSNENVIVLMASDIHCNNASLVDADVEVHGVLGTLSVGAGNRRSDAMFVGRCDDIAVIAPPREDWSPPLRDIGSLLTYRSGTKVDDIVHVAGVVTLIRSSHHFFVQKGASGILVEPIVEGVAPPVGKSIEVLGHLTQDDQGLRRLVAARVRPSASAQHFDIRRLTEQDLDEGGFGGALV